MGRKRVTYRQQGRLRLRRRGGDHLRGHRPVCGHPRIRPFGVLWTLLAAGITIASFYQAFGKKYTGPEIHIEDEECGKSEDVQQRLETLRALYEQKLITPEEYERKRQEILKEL